MIPKTRDGLKSVSGHTLPDRLSRVEVLQLLAEGVLILKWAIWFPATLWLCKKMAKDAAGSSLPEQHFFWQRLGFGQLCAGTLVRFWCGADGRQSTVVLNMNCGGADRSLLVWDIKIWLERKKTFRHLRCSSLVYLSHAREKESSRIKDIYTPFWIIKSYPTDTKTYFVRICKIDMLKIHFVTGARWTFLCQPFNNPATQKLRDFTKLNLLFYRGHTIHAACNLTVQAKTLNDFHWKRGQILVGELFQVHCLERLWKKILPVGLQATRMVLQKG